MRGGQGRPQRRGKALGSAVIQQLRETHPMCERVRPDQPTINLRESLSQRNESRNLNNSARYLRKEEQRPSSIERPLTTSTPAPRQRTPPRMSLKDICEKYNDDLHWPKEKKARSYRPSREQGRQSYIPTQEQARREDEDKYGGKEANDERIARNKEKDERRWQELKIKKMEEDLEKERWKCFENLRSPPPRRSKSSTIIFNKDDRREHEEYEEIFGGPRRNQDPHPGTSTGSRPSGRMYRDFRVRRDPSDNEEEEEGARVSREEGHRRLENGRGRRREKRKKGKAVQRGKW